MDSEVGEVVRVSVVSCSLFQSFLASQWSSLKLSNCFPFLFCMLHFPDGLCWITLFWLVPLCDFTEGLYASPRVLSLRPQREGSQHISRMLILCLLQANLGVRMLLWRTSLGLFIFNLFNHLRLLNWWLGDYSTSHVATATLWHIYLTTLGWGG